MTHTSKFMCSVCAAFFHYNPLHIIWYSDVCVKKNNYPPAGSVFYHFPCPKLAPTGAKTADHHLFPQAQSFFIPPIY